MRDTGILLLLLAASAGAQERSLFFEGVEHLEDLSSPAFEAKPDISNDKLTLLFASAKDGGLGELDVWETTRPSPDAPFGPDVNVTELNSTARDHTPTTNADETLIIYSSSREGGVGSDDAWASTRPSKDDPWGPPVNLTVLNSKKRDMGFTMTPDGLCLYFSSNRGTPGGELEGTFDLYVSTRPDVDADWAEPTPIAELNTPFNDKFPSVTGDNCELYFASDRPGSVLDDLAQESQDTWVAMRPSVDSPWTVVENVFETNTKYNEYLMSVADDHSELFFVADLPSALGSYDLYRTDAIPGAVRYGEGSEGVFGIPRLRVLDEPKVASPDFVFEVSQMSPDDAGVLVAGTAPGPGPLLFDPAAPFFRVVFQQAGGGNPPASDPRIVDAPIPPIGALVGETFWVQALVLEEGGDGEVGFAATPGNRITIQEF